MPERNTNSKPVGSVTVEDVVPAVKAGLYLARFDGVTLESNDQGTFWLWSFMLDVPGGMIEDTAQYGTEDSLIPLTSTSSPRITPRTKAAKWLEGLGQKITVGESVDFEKLVGSVCQVLTIVSENGYSRIENVLPAPPANQRPAKSDK
jgi:hypothetical protein